MNKFFRGMTLVEVIFAIAILFLVMGAVYAFQINIFKYNTEASGSFRVAQDAQLIVKMMGRELRGSAPSANGAYAIVSVSTSSVAFYSDIDGAGTTELVRYYLVGNNLQKSVIIPTGAPAVYNPASALVRTIITNVRNSTSTPAFLFYDGNYDGTSAPMPYPIQITNIRLIEVILTLDIDPNNSPLPLTYSVRSSLRNLKSNL